MSGAVARTDRFFRRADIPQPDWRLAACRGADVDLWFPAVGASYTAAIEVCGQCPIRDGCGEYAVEAPEMHGVWGGLSPRDRARLRGRRRRVA